MACNENRAATLAAFSAGRLDAAGVDACLDHVEGCAACSDELDLAAALLAGPLQAQPARPRLPRARWALVAAAAALLLVVLWPRPDARDARSLARLEPIPMLAFVARGPDQDAAAEHLEAAREGYARGDFATAARELARVRALFPDDPRPALYAGIASAQLGDWNAAAQALEAAARLGAGLLRERALWYGANVALARADVPAARELLAELLRAEGDYALDARALLARLDALGARGR